MPINMKRHQYMVIFVTLSTMILWFLLGGVQFSAPPSLSGKRVDENNIMISVQAKKQFLHNKSKGLTEENTKLFRKVLDDAGLDQRNMDYWLDTKTWTIYGEEAG